MYLSDFNRGTNLKNWFSIEHKFLCWKAKPACLSNPASAFFFKWDSISPAMMSVEQSCPSNCLISREQHFVGAKCHLSTASATSKRGFAFQQRNWCSVENPFARFVPSRLKSLTDTNKNINWNDRFGLRKWKLLLKN